MKTEIDNLIIEDVEPADFRLFLNFVYGGIGLDSVKVEDALPLMICGKKFKVPSLTAACEEVLKCTITIDSALTLFEQALHYNSTDLETSTIDFICKNARQVVHLDEFTKLSAQALKLIVERDDAQVRNELELFEAVVKWAKAECARQEMDPNNPKYMRSVMEPILKYLRFPQMTASAFALKVARMKILTSDEVVDILPYFHVSQDERATLPSEFFISTSRNYYVPRPSAIEYIVTRLAWEERVGTSYVCDPITKIMFKVDKCVWISSVGVSPFPIRTADVNVSVEAGILNASDENEVYGRTEQGILLGGMACVHVEFAEPIKIVPSTWYIVQLKITQGRPHTNTHADVSNGIVCAPGVTFEFQNTDTRSGLGRQIPEIGYRLEEE